MLLNWLVPMLELSGICLGIGLFIAFLTRPIEMLRLGWRVVKEIGKAIGFG